MHNRLHPNVIKQHVDFLFTLPNMNPDESNVDEEGNKFQLIKISHNSPQAIDCVKHAYKIWQAQNPNNTIDEWSKYKIDLLNIFKDQTTEKELNLKIGAYINLVNRFVSEEKERIKNNKLEDEDFLDGHTLKTWTDKIAFLHELGVLSFLMKNYPNIKKPSKLASLIRVIIGGEIGTIKTNISALLGEDGLYNKNYPQLSTKGKDIIKKLNEDNNKLG